MIQQIMNGLGPRHMAGDHLLLVKKIFDGVSGLTKFYVDDGLKGDKNGFDEFIGKICLCLIASPTCTINLFSLALESKQFTKNVHRSNIVPYKTLSFF